MRKAVVLVAWLLALGLLCAGCATKSGSESAGSEPNADPARGRVLVAQREAITTPEALSFAPLPGTPAPTLPIQAARPTAQGLPSIPGSVDAPILMYHHVQEVPPESRDAYLKDLSVSPAAFRTHISMLAELGVQTVGLDEILDYLYGRTASPARPVVLTFDDGYDDTYTQAYPVLRERGMRATVFVITDFVDQPGYLTWDQVRELAREGWSIQSHTRSHPDLRTLRDPELGRQLADSRQRLESELGKRVSYLSYPAGMYDRRVIDAASVAGYRAAVTVQHGTRFQLRQIFELPRVRVHGSDDAETLRAALLPAVWR